MAKLNCLNLDIIDIDLAVRNNWNAATWQSHQSSVLSFRWNIAPASFKERNEPYNTCCIHLCTSTLASIARGQLQQTYEPCKRTSELEWLHNTNV
jgi:hypothetical protein